MTARGDRQQVAVAKRRARHAAKQLARATPLMAAADRAVNLGEQLMPALRILVEQVERIDSMSVEELVVTGRNGSASDIVLSVDRRVWEHDLMNAAHTGRSLLAEIEAVAEATP